MRIIAGTARGRSLAGPTHDGVRPTGDRVRQVLFDLLGQRFEGGAVLDLYCGTGALALEALSRGCAQALLVDGDPRSLSLAERNAAALGFAGQVRALRLALPQGLPQLKVAPCALVFADPPYEGAAPALQALLRWAAASGTLAEGGVLAIETSQHVVLGDGAPGLYCAVQRKVGDTLLHLYRWEAPGTPHADPKPPSELEA